jgi:large subunit ribosomal protein L4
MELEVYKIDGSKTSRKVKLDDGIFGIEPNDHAIYLDVKQFQANQRQGTHASLEKSMVSGTTKKFKRQKGTGGARAGSMKSPLFVGGARAFGPQPRDYRFKLNKKLKILARKSALSYKAKEENITILEDFAFEEIRTKMFKSIMDSLNMGEEKTLIVLPDTNEQIMLSARNLKKAKVIVAASLNTYDILDATKLVLLEGSIQEIERIHKYETKENIQK